ncbi:MAG: hypothetical protein KKA84_04470 [Bacteroidetes bacterium]|nr:hypothetical protein [Bacteroidota bacterium]
MNYLTDFKEKNNNWDTFTINSSVDIELEKGLVLTLETTKEDVKKLTKNKILDWSYKILENKIHTEIILEKIEPNLFTMSLDGLGKKKIENISTVVGAFVLISLSVLSLLIYSILNFPKPDFFWSFIGNIIRTSVVIIFSITPFIVMYLLLSKGYTILRIYISQIIFFFSIIVVIFWCQISSPPANTPADSEPVQYLIYLFGALKIFISDNINSITTASFFTTLFGLGGITKILDYLIKKFSPKE